MKSPTRYLMIRTVAAAGLAALALVLGLPIVRAEGVQLSDEPWYQQTSAEARQRAQEVFAQAVDKHQQLLRGEALKLYEQALALWDNPDIRWNLALVLEDLGQYLRAYQQLARSRRWGAALGPERLRELDDRMRALETRRLARIETHREEPLAEITVDGQPWPSGAGRWSKLVLPGEHYVAARKHGYFSVTQSVYVKAGQKARVALPMDKDGFLVRRRWTAWKPWAVVAAGATVSAVGAGLQWRAFVDLSGRAEVEHGLGIGAIAAGGTAIAVGLALAWLNQPRAHRTEARASSRIELVPILSPQRAELSTLIRF